MIASLEVYLKASGEAKNLRQLNKGVSLMAKCVICERRPAKLGDYCANCSTKLENQRNTKANGKPRYFLTYKGHVVGLFPNGKRTLAPRLLKRSPDHLPKRNTINLNIYCEGYTRERIKAFKACVLKLAHA